MVAKLLKAIVLGVLAALLILWLYPELRKSAIPLPSPHLSMGAEPMSFNSAVRGAAPAVVNVYNRSMGQNTQDQTLGIRNLGSGVIMDPRGYILTNQHVISSADQIIVALQDGRVYEAMLVGSDTMTDLAVLKIDATNLPQIPLNAERPARIGDVVLAIGNPYNLGQTITQGIISATGRIGLSTFGRQNFLQTDASINRGNSGGALVNSLGELVGINTLSLDKSNSGEAAEGIGFAIPVALATKIMHKLIRDGRVIRGYIGVQGREIVPSTTQSFSMERIQGIMIAGLDENGPGAKAGLHVRDIVTAIDGKPAISAVGVMDQVAEIRPGSEVPVSIIRDGKEMTLPVTITEYPIH
ncbi:MAG: outer membrane-stress sensor serine endopeptidase DegS [Plesiomonas shigelloides]